MNPLHLIWIIPLSAFIGFMTCAILSANKQPEQSTTPRKRGGA